MSYRVNEIFKSVQGEGYRQDRESVFLRFTGCNLRCAVEPGPRSPGGFDCDTEFVSGVRMSAFDIVNRCDSLWAEDPAERWVVITGGEPTLQLDQMIVDEFHGRGWKIQIETNGTARVNPDYDIDFITVSPKVAEHALKQLFADEVKYVRGYGQALPKTRVNAKHYFISPAFDGSEMNEETIQWCNQLSNTKWQVSIQKHKLDNIR